MLRSLPDIVGNGTLQPLVPAGDNRTASWIEIIVTGTAATSTRVGDANISASQGAPIPCGGSQFLPWRKPPEHSPYKLAQVYVLPPVNATCSFLYDDD